MRHGGGAWPRLLAAVLLLLTGCVGVTPGGPTSGLGLVGSRWTAAGGLPTLLEPHPRSSTPAEPPSCRAQTLPSGWPESASDDGEALLAPFLSCTSPAEFLALQERVDMPRLVARLDAWHAVRLGALGPMREEAAGTLNRQRAAFLLRSLERYGPATTEVLAHFVLDSSHDDDLRELLFLLAQDKQLQEVLEQLPSLGPALEARGLKPQAHAERDFQWSDVGRGLGRAGKDALATSPLVNGAHATLGELDALKAQLPLPYQRALAEVEHEQLEQQFSPGNLTLGFLDHMTFGVPLGVYGLVAGTSHGVHSLAQGQYERATRELAPAALVVALYAGGKGARVLGEAGGIANTGARALSGWEVVESRLKNLQGLARQLQGRLGPEGVNALAESIRAHRDAGRFVAVGGADAALALHEARGDVAQAQAMLSRARPGATGALEGAPRPMGVVEHLGSVAALVDEQAGLTREVVEARLAQVELETPGPRLSKDVRALQEQRPSLETPPPEARGNPRWSEYVAYYERRLEELQRGQAVDGPLRWAAYERMWGGFTRGMNFERTMSRLLREDAQRPRAERRYLRDFDNPRVERSVGVMKPDTGLRFADVLVIEEATSSGQTPRIETFSFKSRDFSGMDNKGMEAQMLEDAREALRKYGETLDIRRESLQSLLRSGNELPVRRVRLVYEGGKLMPMDMKPVARSINEVRREIPKVEVSVQ